MSSLQSMVWYPVEVDLPDDDETVLVALDDGDVGTGFLDGDTWRWVNALRIDQKVTHWMGFPNHPGGAA